MSESEFNLVDKKEEKVTKRKYNITNRKVIDLKEYRKNYHKDYQKTEKWKEYFSTYLDENKDNLNGRLKQNRLINKELITIITNCIIEKSIFFLHIEDVDKCCNLLKLNMPNSMRKELIHKP
jgi:hypothetical protein